MANTCLPDKNIKFNRFFFRNLMQGPGGPYVPFGRPSIIKINQNQMRFAFVVFGCG